MIVSFVFAAGQNEHDLDRVRSASEGDSVTGADEQNIELVLAFDHDMGYGKTRLDDGPAFRFTMEEFFKKYVLIASESLGQNRGDFSEDFLGTFLAFDIQDFTLPDEPVESIFDDLISFEQYIPKLILKGNGLELSGGDTFYDVHDG